MLNCLLCYFIINWKSKLLVGIDSSTYNTFTILLQNLFGDVKLLIGRRNAVQGTLNQIKENLYTAEINGNAKGKSSKSILVAEVNLYPSLKRAVSDRNRAFGSSLILVSNPLLLLSKDTICGKSYPN